MQLKIFLALSSLLFSQLLLAQADSNLTGWIRVGIDFYNETKYPFSFSNEDKSKFQLPNGFFFTASYYRLLTNRFAASVNSGYGHFKQATIKDNFKSITYSADVIPITLSGHIIILKYKRLGLNILGGGGANWLIMSEFDNVALSKKDYQNVKFVYLYGTSLTYQFGGIRLTFNYVINNFDNRQFKTFGLNVPVYKFHKDK